MNFLHLALLGVAVVGVVLFAIDRGRPRYQKLLRAEVAQTVATFSDVEEELRHLIAALRG